jgi:hypothetical protein
MQVLHQTKAMLQENELGHVQRIDAWAGAWENKNKDLLLSITISVQVSNVRRLNFGLNTANSSHYKEGKRPKRPALEVASMPSWILGSSGN